MEKIPEGKLFEKIRLKNELDLQMFYRTRPVAGDRYQVTYEVRIDVVITPEYFTDRLLSDLNFQDVRSLLGDKTTFHYQKDRNFISGKDKTSILEKMRSDFLDTNFVYLSSRDFPYKLIKKNYRDALAKLELTKKQQGLSTFDF